MTEKKRIIQRHHIQYAHPERKSMRDIVVPIFKGEHKILTLMQWAKTYSKGFIKSLKVFIAQHEDEAVDLETTPTN